MCTLFQPYFCGALVDFFIVLAGKIYSFQNQVQLTSTTYTTWNDSLKKWCIQNCMTALERTSYESSWTSFFGSYKRSSLFRVVVYVSSLNCQVDYKVPDWGNHWILHYHSLLDLLEGSSTESCCDIANENCFIICVEVCYLRKEPSHNWFHLHIIVSFLQVKLSFNQHKLFLFNLVDSTGVYN